MIASEAKEKTQSSEGERERERKFFSTFSRGCNKSGESGGTNSDEIGGREREEKKPVGKSCKQANRRRRKSKKMFSSLPPSSSF